jgi:hypothetical protein
MRSSINLLKSLNQQAVSKVHSIAPPKSKKSKAKKYEALNTDSYSQQRKDKLKKRKEFRTKNLGKDSIGKDSKETDALPVSTIESTASSLEYFELTGQMSASERKSKDVINSFNKD